MTAGVHARRVMWRWVGSRASCVLRSASSTITTRMNNRSTLWRPDTRGRWMSRKLRINWVLAGASLAGGVKSNRLIAEAMVRRGHEVSIVYLSGAPPTPRITTPRRLLKHAYRYWWKGVHRLPHHLCHSTASLVPVTSKSHIEAWDAPDADVSIAGFWKTRYWIENWPRNKGITAYFIRGYETFAGSISEVEGTYRLPGLQFVTSSWLQRTIEAKSRQPAPTIIPNGVDRSQFHAPPRSRASRPTVGFLYGEAPHKDARTAIEALSIVQKAMSTLVVVSYGKDTREPQHSALRSFQYRFKPLQKDIPRLYRLADVWLVPSTQEGFGMPGLEAAACRCPIVSTRCGGPEDYVEPGGNGILVGVGDAQNMARALIDILSLDEAKWREMSDRSYEISQRFDWDRSAEKLERCLYQALDQ